MNFFSNHPICPRCMEPLESGSLLVQIDENIFQCSRCGSLFRNEISLPYNGFDIKFPIFTEIKLNQIESAYIDWILEGIEGNYFITWPWKDVKFIPILLSEYLSKFEGEKIVVFSNLKNLEEPDDLKEGFKDSSYPLLLNSLYILKNEEIGYFNTQKEFIDGVNNYSESTIENTNSIKKTMNNHSLGIDDVFLNNLQVYCKIYFNSFDTKNIKKFNNVIKDKEFTPIFNNIKDLNGLVIPCGYLDDDNNVYKEFLIQFDKFYGKELIKKINGVPYDLFDDLDYDFGKGLLELNFFESYEFPPNLSLNESFNKPFFECLENKFNIVPFSSNFSYSFIKSNEDFDLFSKNDQIYFINEKLLSDELLEKINEFEPNLIVATNIDPLFGNRYKSGVDNQIYKLFKLKYNFLMFSNNLNERGAYKDFENNSFYLRRWNVVPHTWDYQPILDEIRKNEKNELSIFSSNFNKIIGKKSNLKINFHEIKELSIVESVFPIFQKIFKNNSEVNKNLKQLMRTPLFITGPYKDYKIVSYIINLEYLISLIFDVDKEKWNIVKDAFEQVYNFKLDNPRNPIFDELLNLIKSTDINFENLVIIVHHWDKKKLKRLLKEYLDSTIVDQLLISSWTSLNKDLEERETPTYYGISTLFPTLNYDIYSCKLSNLEILCSPLDHIRYNLYLNNRFTERGIKPIYLLSDDDDAPELLKETLELIEIPEDEQIDDFNERLNRIPKGLDDYKDYTNSQGSSNNYYLDTIKEGEESILVLNDSYEAMFLPLNKTVYILDSDDYIDDIELTKEEFNGLVDVNILLNERKRYLSLNGTFLRFVLENDNGVNIRRRRYDWNGFTDLIDSMFKWVDLLNQIVEMELIRTDLSRDEVKDDLSKKISKLKLSARRPIYIKKTWLSEPTILDTDIGEIRIYDAERPKSINDSCKIFEWISDNYKDYDVSRFTGYKTFNAAQELKNIRRSFFRNNKEDLNEDMYALLDDFQEVIKGKISNSFKFKVSEAKIVKIKDEVKPFVIIDDYEEYI